MRSFTYLLRLASLPILVSLGASARAQLAASAAQPTVAATTASGISAMPVTASGGTGPYAFAISPALPTGLSFDAASGTISGTVSPSYLTPVFAGGDDFSVSTTIPSGGWGYEQHLPNTANGAFTVTNGRLEFTTSGGASSRVRGWQGGTTTANLPVAASFTQSWTMEISVTNTFTAANGEFANLGIQVTDSDPTHTHYLAVMLNNGRVVRSENVDGSTSIATATGSGAVRLRLTWDAGAAALKTSYSTDGGATYSALQTITPSASWGANPTTGFWFEVFGNTNAAGSVLPGTIYGDDFRIAAGAPTTETVTVTDANSATASAAFNLSVARAPIVTAITPANAAVGTGVAISGYDLAGVSRVTFGGVRASYTYNTANGTIRATIPAAARTGDVQVTTPGGVSAAFAYTIPLSISSQPQHNVVSANQAASLTVTAGGGAAGATYTYQWRKDGANLSGATESVYYIPSMSSANVGDYDVVVSDGTSTVVGGPAALRLATPDIWTWRNPQPTGNDFNAIAYGAGRYVAVGNAGTIVTSTDGMTWEPQAQRPPELLVNVGSNGSQFVIVGTNGNVLTSTDGLTWTERNVGTAVTLYGVAYGNNLWVVGGSNGGIFTSSDGAMWVRQNSSTASTISSIAATSTGFVATTFDGQVLTSDATGVNWTATQPLLGENLNDIAVGNAGAANGVYAISATGKVFTSTDLTNWTTATLPTSDPGIDWNRIAVTDSGFTIAGASYPGTSPTPKAYIIHSSDGQTWTLDTVPAGPGVQAITSGPAGYVAAGVVGHLLLGSPDHSWTKVSGGSVIPGDLYAAASGPSGTVFAGLSGAVYRSNDHETNWTRIDVGTSGSIFGGVYAAGKYVLVGSDDADPDSAAIVVTSTEANNWSVSHVADTPVLYGVSFDPQINKWVAAGVGGSIFFTADPAGAWTPVTKPTTAALRAGASSGNGRYVLVGDAGAVVYSSDAATWTLAAPVTNVSLQTVAYGNGRFVAAGSNSSSATLRSVIITSTDGINWQNVSVPFTGSIRGLMFTDGRFIAVGGTSSILVSKDGLHWDADTSAFSGLFRAIVRTPRGYAAGGTSGAIATITGPSAFQLQANRTVSVGANDSFAPVSAGNGHAPYTYSISPALPAGMMLDSHTGVVGGMPQTAALVFAGGDDFNTGSDAKWAYFFRTLGTGNPGNGLLEFTNGRLDYSKGTGFGSFFIGWDADGDPQTPFARTTASLATSWVMDVTATNTYSAATGDYADVGMQIAGSNKQFASILLLNRGGSYFVRAVSSGVASPLEASVANGNAVKLRLAWDASAHSLAANYSTNGGTSYTTLATFTPSNSWLPNSSDGGFGFELFGEGGTNAAIAAGSLYLDDFAIRGTGTSTTTIHTITVSDALGLTAQNTFALTLVPAPAITAVSPGSAKAGDTVTIAGANLAEVTTVQFNGVAATNITIVSDTQITAIVPDGATSGPITVTNALHGSGSTTTAFNVLQPPTILDAPTNRRIAAGGTIGWFISAGGVGPFTYQWKKDGTAIAGATNSFLRLSTIRATDAGNYTVTVANSTGAVTSQPATLTVTTPDALLWQQFTDVSSEQSPARTVNIGGKVYVPWSVQDRIPDMVGGRWIGALARFNEADGTLDTSFRIDPRFRNATHVVAQADGKLVIGVRVGDAMTVIRTSDTGALDTSFTAPLFARGIRVVSLQSDGKVLVAATDNPLDNAPVAAIGGAAPTVFRLNGDGTVDPGFTPAVLNANGVLFGPPTVDANGKIYLAGSFNAIGGVARINIARLNADGTLDTAYAAPASLPAGFGSVQARAIVVQSDGRSVAVGDFRSTARGTGGNPMQAIRFNADGSFDATFARPLKTEVGLGTAGLRLRHAILLSDDSIIAVSDRLVHLTANGAVDTTSFHPHPLQKEAFWVSRGANGQLFVPDETGVVGQATMLSTVGSGLATFTADGTPDFSFWTGGWGRTDYPTSGAALSDGRVWVAGSFNRFGANVVPGVAQFAADGTLSANQVASSLKMTAGTVASAGADKIFAVIGGAANSLETSAPALVRLLPSAAVDTTFNAVLPSGYDLNYATLTAAPNGGVVLGQIAITERAALAGSTGDAILRLNADGTRDTTFAATLSSVAQVQRDANNAVTLISTGGVNVTQVLPDGRVLAVAANIDGSLRLLRLTSTGAIDTTFTSPNLGTVAPSTGFSGIITDPVTQTTDQFPVAQYSATQAISAAVQLPNGKVYVGGRLALNGAPTGLVRLNADGSLDTTFTGAGIGTMFADSGPYVAALAVDPAGRVYVAGRFDSFNGTEAHGLFRLAPDGSLDAAWAPSFEVIDVPKANASLVISGEKLYVFGTVAAAGDTLPAPYHVADIPLPLTIATAPAATTALVGAPASLTVTATSTSAISYQWYKGTSAISGATTSALNFGALALTDEGLYSVTLTNAAGTVTTTPVQLTVNAAPTISVQPASISPVVGTTAALSVTATGKPAVTYQWLKGTTAIAGATNASLSFASVQNSDAGTYSVRVINSVTTVTSSTATVTVKPVAPSISGANAATAIAGRSFSFGVTINATSATFTSTTLPAGLTLDAATGVISGVPTQTGTYPVTLTASNVTGSDSRTLTITVNPPPPIITSAAAINGRAGATFLYTITATNTPTGFNAVDLPAGLVVNTTTGAITGTPTTPGVVTMTVSATNVGGTSSTPVVVAIDPALNAPTFSGSTQVSGVQNSAVNFTPSFNTGGQTTTYAANNLPSGLAIDTATGAITGTPSATGTFTVDVTATNSGGSTTVPFTFTVNPPPSAPVITSASTATATVGSSFSFTLTSNVTATSFAATGLPAAGLSLNTTTGVISGTPTAPTTLTVQVSATNNVGTGAPAALVITINPAANAPIINSASVASGRAGDAFSFTLTATNSPTSFAVTSGTLPAGLTLASNGSVTGTPTQVGQVPVWFAATNGSGRGYALQVLFSIAAAPTTPVITSNGTAAGQVGQPFSYQISATNSPTWFAASGLPDGLSLDTTTGVISGIPSASTTSVVAVSLTATNGSGTSMPKTLSLSIAPAPATPVITSPLAGNGQVAQSFTYQMTASNGPTSYVATSLPAGLSVNSTTGAITGIPTTAGRFNVTLRAASAAGLGAASTLVLQIAPAPSAPSITSDAAASGKVGVAFSYQIATNGTATSYGLSGSLPLGLTLNTSTGAIAGTPATSGIFTVQLTATGAGGTSLPQGFVLNIASADNAPVITSANYASATVGQSFSYQITASASPAFPAAPFAAPFTLDAINLPEGLAVNPSTGVIEGQPTTAGTYTAMLVGTNSAGTGPARELTIAVAPAPTAPKITSVNVAPAQVGVPFSYQITATNSPASFEVLGAPAWMKINAAAGTIAGTPTEPGIVTLQLVATNGAGSSNPVTFTVSVAPSPNAPVVVSTRTAHGTVSQPFSYTIAAAVPNLAPPVTSYIAVGVPPGLEFDAASGVISGIPTNSGQFEVSLRAHSTAGDSQPVTLIVTIDPSLSFNLGL